MQVAALDALREFDLLVGGQQRVAPRVREQLVDGLRDEALRRRDRPRAQSRLGGRGALAAVDRIERDRGGRRLDGVQSV